MKAASRVIYYAINNNPKYIFMARKSIETLRRYNSTIAVRVFIFGKINNRVRQNFKTLGTEIVGKPGINMNTDYRFALALKWTVLKEIKEKSALFIDADTLFFGDVALIFNKFKAKKFYGRREAGCDQNQIPCVIDHEMQAKAAAELGGRTLPIFNTGVMLFNDGFHQKLGQKIRLFKPLMNKYLNNKWNYPFNFDHFIEELAGSLFLGTVEGITYGFLSMAITPWYIDLISGRANAPGVVVHTFSHHYEDCLGRVEGPQALAEYKRFS